MNWSPENIEAASRLWREGQTAEAIAAEFGMLKREVYSLAASKRDLFPMRPRGAKTVNVATAEAKTSGAREQWPEKAPGFAGLPSRRLKACQCMFPLWGHHERFDFRTSLYCGAPSEPGQSYCDFHRDISTGKGTPSERRAVKDAAQIGKAAA